MKTFFAVPAFAFAACVLSGCQVEHPQTRESLHEQKTERQQAKLETPRDGTPTKTDEAQLVLNACGAPARDTVAVIHDKLNDGPVRTLTYKGLREVRLNFVPSKVTAGPWEFSGAMMEEEELLTSSKLQVYLPCAAKVLR